MLHRSTIPRPHESSGPLVLYLVGRRPPEGGNPGLSRMRVFDRVGGHLAFLRHHAALSGQHGQRRSGAGPRRTGLGSGQQRPSATASAQPGSGARTVSIPSIDGLGNDRHSGKTEIASSLNPCDIAGRARFFQFTSLSVKLPRPWPFTRKSASRTRSAIISRRTAGCMPTVTPPSTAAPARVSGNVTPVPNRPADLETRARQ